MGATFDGQRRSEGRVTSALRPPFPMAGVPGRVSPDTGCPAVREVLDRVGDKWSVLVVALLGGGARRFTELRRSIDGISQRMLTLTLRALERDGLVTRTAHPTIPPRVEYDLTRFGHTFFDTATALVEWAEQHRVQIQESRQRHDSTLPPTLADRVHAPR